MFSIPTKISKSVAIDIIEYNREGFSKMKFEPLNDTKIKNKN